MKSGMEHGWSARVLIKYTLLQIPGLIALILILLLVKRWANLSPWLIAGIIALWVAKDTVLFPFVWRAYDTIRPGDALNMIGARGIARERLNPSGYVFVRGELWKAEVLEGDPPINEGASLRVRDMHGLKLTVEEERTGREAAQDQERP